MNCYERFKSTNLNFKIHIAEKIFNRKFFSVKQLPFFLIYLESKLLTL